jgi:ribosomal protein L32
MIACVHHWKIDMPNVTGFSYGICKKCGAERHDHRTSMEYVYEQRFNPKLGRDPDEVPLLLLRATS